MTCRPHHEAPLVLLPSSPRHAAESSRLYQLRGASLQQQGDKAALQKHIRCGSVTLILPAQQSADQGVHAGRARRSWEDVAAAIFPG